MDILGSKAPSHARKTIIFVKNRNFYGYFKARRQMTYTSRARNLHRLSKVTEITIKNSIFETFYGFSAKQLIKSGINIHKKRRNRKKIWFGRFVKPHRKGCRYRRGNSTIPVHTVFRFWPCSIENSFCRILS